MEGQKSPLHNVNSEEIITLNEDSVEQSFLTLYDKFLEINLHSQTKYKKDMKMKAILTKMLLVFEDLSEHYYWKEVNRVRDDKEEETAH